MDLNCQLKSLEGSPVCLRDFFAGKDTLMVLFWSAVCSHCRRYERYLNAFSEKNPNTSLAVIACRQGETAQMLADCVKSRSLRFPLLIDQKAECAKVWEVYQTPRVYLVNHQDKLLYRGAIDNFKYPDDPEYVGYLEEALDDLRSGQAVRRAETQSFGCPVSSVYYGM
jgi:peroxiredoxin